MANYNPLKEYIFSRCSSGQFWPLITPIGYGACTRLPFETQASQLCICSTNDCNADYSTCVASVQATQSAPPPNLLTFFPDLTSPITCHQSYQGPTYSDMYHSVGWPYGSYSVFNTSDARAYASSHAVACFLFVNIDTGDWYQYAALYEHYGGFLYLVLVQKRTLDMFVESSTSVLIQGPSMYYFHNTPFYWDRHGFNETVCFCTTNNCNQDLSTCAIGLNASVSTTTAVSLLSTSSTTQTTTPASSASATTGTPTSASSSTTTNTNSTIRATVASTTASPPTSSTRTCFPGTARVRRQDGTVIMMQDVRVGDHLLVAEHTYSPVLAFLVQQQQGLSIDYLQISTTESTLQITPSHLILMRRQGDTSSPRYLQAARLRRGDQIFSIQLTSSGTMKESETIQVVRNVKGTDAFVPLTEAGTLVVDGMLVSCYAQYEHHSLIHMVMLPFRMWNKIMHHYIDAHEQKELHSYIQFWLRISHFLDLLIHSV